MRCNQEKKLASFILIEAIIYRMNITAFKKEHIDDAARLFVQNFRQQRHLVPVLPDRMADPRCAADYLVNLLTHSAGVAAFDGGRLVGYPGWWMVDDFRGTNRKAAYCPVCGHAAVEGEKQRVYRGLYREAAGQWLATRCQTHALTLMAHDEAACQAWFWNGFGLTVVDAVRALDGLGIQAPDGYVLRKAAAADAEALADIEAEHWRHYAEPPTLMVYSAPNTAEEFEQLLTAPGNSVWMAWQGARLVGYIRFEGSSSGATEIVGGDGTTAITGEYVRPQHRGKHLAAALLDAGLSEYRERGYARCSVDFESFNPEAAAFWPKYFEPVCYSVIRVPERA